MQGLDEIDLEALNSREQINASIDEGSLEEPKKEVVKEELKTEIPKEEITDVENTQEIPEEVLNVANTVFENLKNSLGVTFTEEDLEDIELTEDLETVNKLAVLGGKKYGEKLLDELLNSNSAYKKAFEYIQVNGSLSGIEENMSFPDYSKVDISTDANAKMVYRDYLQLRGMDADEIDSMVELAEDKGLLIEKASNAKNALDTHFKGLESEKVNKNSEIIKAREVERQQIVQDFGKVIGSGKILGLNLSPKEQKEFNLYLFQPIDKQGRTERELYDDTELTVEQEAYLEYIKFKKFGNVQPKVDSKVKTLRDLVNSNKGRSTEIGNSKMSTGNFNTGNDIDFEELDRHLRERKK